MTDTSPPSRSHGLRQARPSTIPAELMGPGGVSAAAGWRADVLTLFPEMFPGPLGVSLTGKALSAGLWGLRALDIRSFARDKHRTVDDAPFGGGPGMVMRPDVLAAAIDSVCAGARRPVIYASPRGRPFTQERARALASGEGAVFICGRYEGVDERVLEARGVEELCVGDAVLTGGEIPVMAMIDASVRLLPGVLGTPASLEDESFSRGLLEYPQYTRPPEWEGRAVPEVLLSGHHANIAAWRRSRAEETTKNRRPDLWAAHEAERDPKPSDASPPPRGVMTKGLSS